MWIMDKVQTENAYRGHITYSCRLEICVFQRGHSAGEEWICWLEECFKSKKQKSVIHEGEPDASHPPSNIHGNNRVSTVYPLFQSIAFLFPCHITQYNK